MVQDAKGGKDARHEAERKSDGKQQRPWWLDPVFIIGMALFFFGGPLNYFSSNPRILYLGALGASLLIFYGVHQYVSSLEKDKAPPLASRLARDGPAPAQRNPIPLPEKARSVMPETTEPALIKPKPTSAQPQGSEIGKPQTDPALERIEQKLEEIKKNTSPARPISLTPGDQVKMAEVLSHNRGSEIKIVCIGAGCNALPSIIPVFERAGWRADISQVGMLVMVGYPMNLSVGVHILEREAPPGSVLALKDAFAGVGVALETGPWADIGAMGKNDAKLCLVIGSPN